MNKKKSKIIDPTIAETIRQKILSSDMTQYRIAKETGVGAGILSRFVSGERTISIETADKLCKLLGLRLVDEEVDT